jgi:hypothetical protein
LRMSEKESGTAAMSAEEKTEDQPQETEEEKVGEEVSREETEEQKAEKEEGPTQEETPDTPKELEEKKEGSQVEVAGGEKTEEDTTSEKVPAGVESTEENKEDAGDVEQVEEVVLDQADAGEEKPPEPDTPTPEEETAKENDVREEKTEGAEQAPKKEHKKMGTLALLRKKWVLLSAGGLFLAMGISFVFFGGDSGKTLNVVSLLGGPGNEDQSDVQTVLQPFFIPLPEDSENAAIRLVISVKWGPETLTRYKRRAVMVRNEVYRYLLQAAGSKKDMVEQKSALASELKQVFQHALAVKNVEVRVAEASVI